MLPRFLIFLPRTLTPSCWGYHHRKGESLSKTSSITTGLGFNQSVSCATRAHRSLPHLGRKREPEPRPPPTNNSHLLTFSTIAFVLLPPFSHWVSAFCLEIPQTFLSLFDLFAGIYPEGKKGTTMRYPAFASAYLVVNTTPALCLFARSQARFSLLSANFFFSVLFLFMEGGRRNRTGGEEGTSRFTRRFYRWPDRRRSWDFLLLLLLSRAARLVRCTYM